MTNEEDIKRIKLKIESKELRMTDGMLESLIRNFPDNNLLMLLKKEENFDIKFDLNKLRRQLPGCDRCDFGEKLYLFIKKRKKEINAIDDNQEKLKQLKEFIIYVRKNYDLSQFV